VGARRTPSLESVERARLHLVGLAAAAVLALGAVALALTFVPPGAGSSLAVRASLGLLTVATVAWVAWREVRLRRVTRLLVDERVLNAALSNRLKDLAALSAAGKAVNSALELEEVLDVILSSARELLGGSHGSVMLLDGEELRALCVQGDNPGAHGACVPVGAGVAGHAAATRQPLVVTGRPDPDVFGQLAARQQPVESALCVPLVHRDDLLGVLNVNAAAERQFTDHDVRALTLFAEHAAAAVANARLFDAERALVAQLMELDRMKSEFVATVSHELRTPLTSILGSVQTLRRPDLPAHFTDEFLTMIERQAKRLVQLIEKILSVQRAEMGAGLHPQPLELAPALVDIRRLLAAGGRSIDVRVRPGARAFVDVHAFQQMVLNLVDNAFTHGRPPVEVAVEVLAGGEAVEVTVLDRGDGVDPADAGLLFERFHRGQGVASPGVGLGLYLVRTLAEAHGGRAEVRPRHGGGSAFTIALPCPSALVQVPA
jgi:two-component system sensor histidine kinase KdpD